MVVQMNVFLLAACWVLLLAPPTTLAGRAASKAPKLPEGFCPKTTGVITRTTGECMCNYQHKDGCRGSGCKYEYGLSWYHYSCKDCECIPEPEEA